MDTSSADPREIVAAGYDAVADRYAELEDAEHAWPRLRRLRELLELLPDGSDVLDVGCGNGVPATREIARRHRAVGVDASRRQVELASRNVPTATFVHGDVTSLDLAPASFDAVVAFYVIEHVPRDEHAALLARLGRWLRPGGYLLFTVEPEDEPRGRRGVARRADVLQPARPADDAEARRGRGFRRGTSRGRVAARRRAGGPVRVDPRRARGGGGG